MTNEAVTQRSNREGTSEDRAEVPGEPLDFTGMYATDDAFRRDLDRLGAAADAGKGSSP